MKRLEKTIIWFFYYLYFLFRIMKIFITYYGMVFRWKWKGFSWKCGHHDDVILFQNFVILHCQVLHQILCLAVKFVLVISLHVFGKYHDNLNRKRAVKWSKIVGSRQCFLKRQIMWPFPAITLTLEGINKQNIQKSYFLRKENPLDHRDMKKKQVPFPLIIIWYVPSKAIGVHIAIPVKIN